MNQGLATMNENGRQAYHLLSMSYGHFHSRGLREHRVHTEKDTVG